MCKFGFRAQILVWISEGYFQWMSYFLTACWGHEKVNLWNTFTMHVFYMFFILKQIQKSICPFFNAILILKNYDILDLDDQFHYIVYHFISTCFIYW